MQDFIPLYPLYQPLFADHGLSPAQISILFVIWSTTAFVLEVRVAPGPIRTTPCCCSVRCSAGLGTRPGSRCRRSPASRLGFVSVGYVVRADLRHVRGLRVRRVGRARLHRQVRRPARPGQVRLLIANLAATALAAPLFDLGGYVLACRQCPQPPDPGRCRPDSPEAPPVEPAQPEEDEPQPTSTRTALAEYWSMLRAGVTEALTSRPVRRAVALVALLGGFLAFDEYFLLLARDAGRHHLGAVADRRDRRRTGDRRRTRRTGVQAAGNDLRDRSRRDGGTDRLGALSGTAWGFAPIAIGYGVMQLVIVVAEARLQDSITGPARATVTSVSGFFAEVFAVAVYAGFALGSTLVQHVDPGRRADDPGPADGARRTVRAFMAKNSVSTEVSDA